jgi:hypothetical protein
MLTNQFKKKKTTSTFLSLPLYFVRCILSVVFCPLYFVRCILSVVFCPFYFVRCILSVVFCVELAFLSSSLFSYLPLSFFVSHLGLFCLALCIGLGLALRLLFLVLLLVLGPFALVL